MTIVMLGLARLYSPLIVRIDLELVYALQLSFFLYVFLIVVEGRVNGLVHTLRPWSIAWNEGNSSDGPGVSVLS